MDNRNLTSEFKKIRHRVDVLLKRLTPEKIKLMRERESLKDVGRGISVNELKRRNYQDIFFANIQRIKESLRVLEEFAKLLNKKIALEFKKLRYGIYQLEKKVAEKIPSLYSHR